MDSMMDWLGNKLQNKTNIQQQNINKSIKINKKNNQIKQQQKQSE